MLGWNAWMGHAMYLTTGELCEKILLCQRPNEELTPRNTVSMPWRYALGRPPIASPEPDCRFPSPTV